MESKVYREEKKRARESYQYLDKGEEEMTHEEKRELVLLFRKLADTVRTQDRE